MQQNPLRFELQNTFIDIPYQKIESLIKNARSDLCKVNPGGAYEIWVTFTTSGGIAVVTASGEAGLKAIISWPAICL